MNRQQRRALARANGKRSKGTKIEQLNSAMAVGYNNGIDRGIKFTSGIVFESYCAASAIALKELYKFGPERTVRFLKRVEELMIEYITHEELRHAAYDKCDIEICPDNPVDRVGLKEA